MSFPICEGSVPSIALLQALIKINNKGIITGKLKTGINMLLFPALEAMPDISVNVAEKPIQPIKVANK